MFIGSGERARGRKDGGEKKKGKEPEEVRRKRSAGVGGLRRGSEGPLPRILLCGCSFGFAQVPEGGVPDWPGAWRHPHFDLPPLSRLQNPPRPGAGAPGPSPAAPGPGRPFLSVFSWKKKTKNKTPPAAEDQGHLIPDVNREREKRKPQPC